MRSGSGRVLDLACLAGPALLRGGGGGREARSAGRACSGRARSALHGARPREGDGGERRSLQATGGSERFELCERRKRRERGSGASGGSGAERRDVVGGAERSRERRAYRESDARKDRAAQRAARPRRLVLQRIWGGPVLQYRHLQ